MLVTTIAHVAHVCGHSHVREVVVVVVGSCLKSPQSRACPTPAGGTACIQCRKRYLRRS